MVVSLLDLTDYVLIGGQENIRDFISISKNNSGRDVMIESPRQ